MNLMRVSDYIAKFLGDKGVDLVFTITGAGNVRLIESISQAGIQYICPHHEQAAVMASLVRQRISGKPAVCLVTGGPGAANTLIAVADAHLDSIPCVVIAGQEKLEFIKPSNTMRGKGVQGLDMVTIMTSVTKFSVVLRQAKDVRYVLEQAFYKANSDRPGPVWIDVPQDLQWEMIDAESLVGFTPDKAELPTYCDMQKAADTTLKLISAAQRPLLWVGHGIRLSGCEGAFRQLFDALGVPALVSWQGADLVPDDHSLFVGRAGTYGQRWANLALQNCDLLIALGTRLAIPQRGYADSEFARAAKKVIVEIDPLEISKFDFEIDLPVLGNVKDFIDALNKRLPPSVSKTKPLFQFDKWFAKCRDWRVRYPMSHPPKVEQDRVDPGINSYWFIDRLSQFLMPDDIIVTDMGASLTCTHATIRIKDGQRLVTSTGLGEMGFGLPGAIGAAMGSSGRRVVLIVGEGSLMMNLQELQTLTHLQLPIKIFLFNNNGYLTIKHTHNALFASKGFASATDPKTGVSFPNFSKIAEAFKLDYSQIATAEGLDPWIQSALATSGSVLAEVVMPEFQELLPKSSIKLRSDGSIYSPPLEDLYPFLPPDQLAQEMIIPILVS
jgi:acetolactate synthase-1/2/3 large subunit